MRTHLRILALCLCAPALSLPNAFAKEGAAPSPAQFPVSDPAASPVVKLRGEKVDAPALRAKAKVLRDKSSKRPGTKEAQEAELEEADILIKLAAQKDPELDQRRHQLVEKLKKDETLPKSTRFRLAGASANIEITTDRTLDSDARMDAYAKVAWKLVEDFPENPESYASLLRIARDSNDAQAAKIAADLLLSAAPDAVKEAALVLHERSKLVGRSFAEVVGDAIQADMPTDSICLLTWTASRPETLTIAHRIVQDLPSGTVLVAICLDVDSTAARVLAEEKKVPAFFVYPEGGRSSLLCQRLHLGDGSVYLIDANGKITTTSALRQLGAQRRQKAKEAGK